MKRIGLLNAILAVALLIGCRERVSLLEEGRWIAYENISFRGSKNHQGESLTTGSTAKFTTYQFWRYNKVGKFIYPKAEIGGDFDAARWQMEIKYKVSPDVVISDVMWDIKREVSGVTWGPGSGTLTPDYNGETGWSADDPNNDDEDLTQNPTLTEILEIDGPGHGSSNGGLEYLDNYRFTMKAKFQDWVEVSIGSYWYVCSKYKNWRSIMHVKYEDATSGWVQDASKTNLIDSGTISGFAGDWSED